MGAFPFLQCPHLFGFLLARAIIVSRHAVVLDLLVFDGELLEKLVLGDLVLCQTRLIRFEMIDEMHGTDVLIHFLIIVDDLEDHAVCLGQTLATWHQLFLLLLLLCLRRLHLRI